jgi:hypothetical protein
VAREGLFSSICLKRSRHIESLFKFKRGGAFALVDAKEALGKAKRDARMGLLLTSTQKERATISLEAAAEAEASSRVASGHILITY